MELPVKIGPISVQNTPTSYVFGSRIEIFPFNPRKDLPLEKFRDVWLK